MLPVDTNTTAFNCRFRSISAFWIAADGDCDKPKKCEFGVVYWAALVDEFGTAGRLLWSLDATAPQHNIVTRSVRKIRMDFFIFNVGL
jgi:hypothetical protein